jgi:hypothetical protein
MSRTFGLTSAAFTAALVFCGTLSGAAAAQTASFVVVHGIPGRDVAAGLDPTLPVDVQVDGKYCLLQGLTFGTIAGPFDVPAGTYSVAISLANPIKPCSNGAVISGNVTLAAGEFGSVVAALSRAGKPTAEVFAVDASPVAAGMQRIITAHAADVPPVTVVATSLGGGSTEKAAFSVDPGKENESSVPTRTAFSLSVKPQGAPLLPAYQLARFGAPLGDQSVSLVFAVGSAATGSATLLTRTLSSVH